jgi:hypothetical protein
MKSTPKLPSSSRLQMASSVSTVKMPTKKGKAISDVKQGGVSGGLVKAASTKKGMPKGKKY